MRVNQKLKKIICIYRFVRNPAFLQLYSIHIYWRCVPCTTFRFCRKYKDNSLFVPLVFFPLWVERDFLSDIFPKVQLIFQLNLNLNFLHIKFYVYFVLYYSTFRCPQVLWVIWFCQFLFMLKLTSRVI